MREFVAFEVLEGHTEVDAEARPLACADALEELRKERPSETRMADLVRPDAGEVLAQRSGRHLEPLGANECDGDRLDSSMRC